MLLATAGLVSHLVPLPLLLLGLAVARWPEGLASLYAKIFGDLGFEGYRRTFDSQPGVWLVRVVGVQFAAVSGYWIVVGTG